MDATDIPSDSPQSQDQSPTIPPIEQQPTTSEQQSSSTDNQHISPSRSALSDQLSTPSKDSTGRSNMEPIDALSVGLLSEFKCLKDLETQLEQIVNNQKGLIENISSINGFYTQNEELMEAQLMVS